MKEQDRERVNKHPQILELSGEQYRNIVEQLNDALYIIDFKGNILYCNRNAARMTGYSREELSGAHLSKLDSAASVAAEFQKRIEILMKESAILFEVEHLRKDGSLVPVEVDAKLVSREGEGQIHCFVRDITHRKEAEGALASASRQWQQTFDSSFDGLCLLDREQRILRINKQMARMFAVDPEEAVGKHCWDIVHGGMADDDCPVPRMLESRQREMMELVLNDRIFEVTADPILDETGKLNGIVHIIREISERKHAEEALMQSEADLLELFDNAPVGYHELDLQGRISRINRTELEMLGHANEEMLGRYGWEFVLEKEKSEAAVKAKLAGEQSPSSGHERFFRRKDGTTFPVLLEERLLYDPDGRIRGIRTIIQDISERTAAEQAMRESEEKFRTFADESPNMIFINQQGRVVYVNNKCVEIMGYAKEEFYAPEFRFQQTIAPEDMGRLADYFRQHMSGREVLPYEYTVITKDGRRLQVIITTKLIPYENGRAILGIITDITERKQAEMALAASEEKFRKAFASSPMITGISRLADGCFLDVNDNFTKKLGWERLEVIGRTSRELGIFNNYLQREEMAAHIKQHGSVTNYIIELKTKSCEIRTTEFSAELIDIEGEKCLLAQINDITERKRAEDALRQSEIKYYSLFNQSVEGIYLHDFNGRIIDVNLMACIQSGYSREELLERTVFDLHPQPAEAPVQSRQEIINQWRQWQPEERHSLEAAHQRKNGTVFPVQISTGIIRYGEEDLLLAIVRDISERKQAENEIRALNQELEERIAERTAHLEAANRELEAFAYSISHDLRTPLRHINGFVNLLHERLIGQLDEESKEDLETVIAATNHMGALIDDLLSFSRMGRQEMSQTKVDLGELVREVIHDLKAETEGRKIEWRIAKLATVTGDRAMLRIVLFNLLANAVKYTRPRQAARIEIGLGKGEQGETVIFVRDNGVGFDMQFADKLFGVFQRLHRVDEFEGTGIGLANVRRIINRHGGRTWGEGEIDKGATFYFSLPKEQGKG